MSTFFLNFKISKQEKELLKKKGDIPVIAFNSDKIIGKAYIDKNGIPVMELNKGNDLYTDLFKKTIKEMVNNGN